MADRYRVLGFIFKKRDLHEADRVFTTYCKNVGKLNLLARSERKIKSKLRYGLELFYLSRIEFVQGKNYKTIIDVSLINRFRYLRNDLRILSVAYRISELLDDFLNGQEKDEEIWNLIIGTFRNLNNLGRSIQNKDKKINYIINRLRLIYYYFFWNFIFYLGYKPSLYNCVLCHNALGGKDYSFFSSEKGGVVCCNCAKRIKGLVDKNSARQYNIETVNSETILFLKRVLEKDWISFFESEKNFDCWDYLENISNKYYRYFVPRMRSEV